MAYHFLATILLYIYNAANADVSWMDMTMLTTVKVTKCKSGPFKHAISMFKWPTGSVYVGIIF